MAAHQSLDTYPSFSARLLADCQTTKFASVPAGRAAKSDYLYAQPGGLPGYVHIVNCQPKANVKQITEMRLLPTVQPFHQAQNVPESYRYHSVGPR